MTELDQFEELEHERYVKDVTELLQDDRFKRTIAHWVIDSRRPTTRPVRPEELSEYNFRIGYSKLMEDFMESLEQVAPQRFMEVAQEVLNYGQRRDAAVARDEQRDRNEYSGDDDPGDDDRGDEDS